MNFSQMCFKHNVQHAHLDGVQDGWVPALDALMTNLVALGWDRNLRQCKEKYGGLRFEIGACTDAMLELIDETEIACDGMCEDCGADGETRTTQHKWLRTLCDACHAPKAEAAHV